MTEEIIKELDHIFKRLCEIDPLHKKEHQEYISLIKSVYLASLFRM